MAVVPLRRRQRNLGVFSLLCETGDHLAGEGLPLLTTIADQLAVAVENIRLRQITRQSAIIEERERLSRDIHDAITQAIYGIALFAETAVGYASAGKMDKVRQSIQSIQQASDQALRELRLLLYELRTERLARKGLVGALRERLHTVEHRADIAGEVHAPPLDGLPVPLEETFYRVALEALNNSLRHSRAKQVDVSLMIENGHLVMSIIDDGIGFDPATAIHAGGIGLDSMHKRMGKVGGVLRLSSRPGRGTKVVARAPLLAPPPGENGAQG
jgi:signal transduction histidine kinase